MIKKMKRLIPKQVKKIFKKKASKSKTRTNPKYSESTSSSLTVLNGLVAYNKFGGYFTPLSSKQRPAVQKILNGNVFEPDTISFMRNNCVHGDIIHAGTYFGDFLPGLAGALSNGAKIWAFEPNIENFRCAQITSLINNLNNVQLFNTGLGERNTTTQMLIESEFGVSLGGTSKILKERQKGKTIDVKIVRIDDVIPTDRNISIIQLDVEGYEKEALNGALNTIKRCKPILILEDNNKIIDTNWFADNILAIGYEIKGKIHANTLLEIKTPHTIV